MPLRSQRITRRDIRIATDTVHECRDLWADPPAWQAHLMRRAASLAGSRIGIYFEMADHAGMTADRVLSADDTGWESAGERTTVIAGIAHRPLRYSPLWAAFADVLSVRGRCGLTTRQDRVIDKSTWQASEMYDRHVRPTRLGEVVLSAVWMPQSASWSIFSLVTDRADPTQTQRHARLARLLHARIAPMIGSELSTWRDRTVATLSATRRRVLVLLLEGHGESRIAREAFRSRSAVHEHVTAIYRHFDVNSRAELASFFLRRRPVSAGEAMQMPSLDEWLDDNDRRGLAG